MKSGASPWLVPNRSVRVMALRNYCKASPALRKPICFTSICPTANRAPMFGYDRCLDMTAGPRPSPSLRDVIEKYRQMAGGFGPSVALAAFGLSPEETEHV